MSDAAQVICIGCQQINSQLHAVFNTLQGSMIHAEIACKCDKCGKMISTGRVYNHNLYVMNKVQQPLVKVN